MAKKTPSAISAEMLDELLEGQDPATVLRSDGLLGELKKALAERIEPPRVFRRLFRLSQAARADSVD